jgi:hypothetical protein
MAPLRRSQMMSILAACWSFAMLYAPCYDSREILYDVLLSSNIMPSSCNGLAFAALWFLPVWVCNTRVETNGRGQKISTLPQLRQVDSLNSEFPGRSGR